ncbi:MAG: BsaWI family type II restriction enzyme [Candidatus Bathyarchaeota archaeon]|nr:BsaWI family type II restriction enzyme [Candidatus Bathyarchaeota archaeon]
MKIDDLIELYEEKRKTFGMDVYKHVSELFEEAKIIHYKDWLAKPTAGKDHEQSWRAWKGKNLEKLVLYMLKKEVEVIGLKMVSGNLLERSSGENLSHELSTVKRNLLVDYGEFGSHLPDVDIVIYQPNTYRVLAVISSKVTLRERIAQTGYWKNKLYRQPVTEHIKVYFVTPDEDNTLMKRNPVKKGRAIVEVDTDGSYVMCGTQLEESNKVKTFDKFVKDLKKIT